LGGRTKWTSVGIFTMAAITFDGVKYANVRSDLVRSSRCLFPKFGRSTLIPYATHLAKIWGKEFIPCTVKCRTLIFRVLRVTLCDHGADPFQTPKTDSQRRWRRHGIWNLKSHHFWCDFALLFLQSPGIFDSSRLRRLLHGQYSTYKYKKIPLCSQLYITWSGEVWGQEDGCTPCNLTPSQKFTNSWKIIVFITAGGKVDYFSPLLLG
jgi:hypothetical protein